MDENLISIDEILLKKGRELNSDITLNDLLQEFNLKEIDSIIQSIGNDRIYQMLLILRGMFLENKNEKYKEVLKVANARDIQFRGFLPFNKDFIFRMEYLPRSYVEENSNYRQLVENTLIVYRSNHTIKYGFLKEKAHTFSEYSMIGGHINCNDNLPTDCLKREINEELKGFDFNKSKIIPLGIVAHDTGISKYHLGYLYVYEVNNDDIFAKENGNQFIWLSKSKVNELLNKDSEFDSWTKVAIEQYQQILLFKSNQNND